MRIRGLEDLKAWAERQARTMQDAAAEAAHDPAVQGIMVSNADAIWSTRGTAIGADWEGRELADTGQLRRDARTPDIRASSDGRTITITHGPSYSAYVQARWTILDLGRGAASDLADLYLRHLTATWETS